MKKRHHKVGLVKTSQYGCPNTNTCSNSGNQGPPRQYARTSPDKANLSTAPRLKRVPQKIVRSQALVDRNHHGLRPQRAFSPDCSRRRWDCEHSIEGNVQIGGARSTAETMLPLLRSLPIDLPWSEATATCAHPLDDGTALMLERSIEATVSPTATISPDRSELRVRGSGGGKALFHALIQPSHRPPCGVNFDKNLARPRIGPKDSLEPHDVWWP